MPEATLYADEAYGERQHGPICGKPGAWRNRPSRCEHGVERSVTRCWSCDPPAVAREVCHIKSAQRKPRDGRLYTADQRDSVLRALLNGPVRLSELPRFGLQGDAIQQLVKALRGRSYVLLESYSTLVLSGRGRKEVEARQ